MNYISNFDTVNPIITRLWPSEVITWIAGRNARDEES
jgi:hypothetical protein